MWKKDISNIIKSLKGEHQKYILDAEGINEFMEAILNDDNREKLILKVRRDYFIFLLVSILILCVLLLHTGFIFLYNLENYHKIIAMLSLLFFLLFCLGFRLTSKIDLILLKLLTTTNKLNMLYSEQSSFIEPFSNIYQNNVKKLNKFIRAILHDDSHKKLIRKVKERHMTFKRLFKSTFILAFLTIYLSSLCRLKIGILFVPLLQFSTVLLFSTILLLILSERYKMQLKLLLILENKDGLDIDIRQKKLSNSNIEEVLHYSRHDKELIRLMVKKYSIFRSLSILTALLCPMICSFTFLWRSKVFIFFSISIGLVFLSALFLIFMIDNEIRLKISTLLTPSDI